jgi:hypothetical protein
MKIMRKIVLTALPALIGTVCFPQEHRVKGALPAIATTGFYQIPVTPLLSAHANLDLSDVRIVDGNGRQAPYVLLHESGMSSMSFRSFPILGQATDTINTTVELETGRVGAVGEILLVLANTAVERTAAISGSADRIHWFAIAEDVRLQTSPGTEPDEFAQVLRFPAVSYPYLRLVIRNGRKDPLHILRAGTSRNIAPVEPLLRNPTPRLSQRDSSNGTTYLSIIQSLPYRVDRLYLSVKGPRFYQRAVRLYTVEGEAKSFLASASLRSGDTAGLAVEGVKASAFLVEIDNGDSPPLAVTAAGFAQKQVSLVTYLDAGERYTMLAGLPGARAPQYDLQRFSDSIPTGLPLLHVGSFSSNVAATKKAAGGFDPMWLALLVGLGALGFLTYRLLGEVTGSSRK